MAAPTQEVQKSTAWPVAGGPPPRGSVAWVVGVGGQHGTGASIARKLAAEGLHVVATGRTKAKVDALVADIRQRGGLATGVTGDAGTEEGLAESLTTVDGLGALSVAVYNAGGSQWRSSILAMESDFFEDVWRTNCFGSFVTGREAARRMVAGAGGVVVFTGSISGRIARPKLAAYASAKFGQRAVAQAMGREFGPRNVHVANVIVHGPIDGDRLNTAFPQAKEARPVDGMVDPDVIAETFWSVIVQPRSAWTHEMDIRPYCEPF